jgi:hypothetical protein
MSGPTMMPREVPPGTAMRTGRSDSRNRSLYVRALRLRNTNPGWLLSLVLFEGSAVIGLLAGFAELVDWWGVPLIPLCVAAAVKFNDVLVGVLVAAGFTGTRGELGAAAEATVGWAPVAEHLKLSPSPTARARVPRPAPPSWAWPTMAEQEQVARGVARVDGAPEEPSTGGRGSSNGRPGEASDAPYAPTYRPDPGQIGRRLGNQRRFDS